MGLGTVRGTRCHHVVVLQDHLDFQLWIEDGDRLLPRKLVVTYHTLPKSPQYTAVMTKWNLRANLPERRFEFEPPNLASRIPFAVTPPRDLTTKAGASDSAPDLPPGEDGKKEKKESPKKNGEKEKKR